MEALTEVVVTNQVTLDVPATTVTVAGIEAMAAVPVRTERATMVSESTVRPKSTLPVLVFPPTTEEGENVTAVGTFGVTVSVPVLLPLFAVAEI